MKRSDTRAFANQLLVCLLVTFGFGGTIGLGTVWVRHQNALLAKSNRVLEARISDTQRRLAEVTTQIENERGSDMLRRDNITFHLGFAPAPEAQIQRITEDPELRLASRNRGELSRDRVITVPMTVRFALKN